MSTHCSEAGSGGLLGVWGLTVWGEGSGPHQGRRGALGMSGGASESSLAA